MLIFDIKVGMLKTNCYVIVDGDTKESAVIDPGDEFESIINVLDEHELKPSYILITHGHYDHIMAAEKIRGKYGAKIICHKEAEPFLAETMLNGAFYNGCTITVKPDQTVDEDDIIKLGNTEVKVLHVPGHAPGSACYYIESEDVVFTGDTLFKDTVGVTDIFPYGNHSLLVQKIKEKLLILPYETVVYPGHGACTTVGYEKRNNYYLR